jgi:hypothetical protein
MAEFFKHGCEPSGFIKCGEFRGWLRNCWNLKKDCVPWSDLVSYKLTVASGGSCGISYFFIIFLILFIQAV